MLQALWRLGRSAIKSVRLGIVGAIAVLAAFLGVSELLILAAAGVVVLIWTHAERGAGDMPLVTPMTLQRRLFGKPVGLGVCLNGAIHWRIGRTTRPAS